MYFATHIIDESNGLNLMRFLFILVICVYVVFLRYNYSMFVYTAGDGDSPTIYVIESCLPATQIITFHNYRGFSALSVQSKCHRTGFRKSVNHGRSPTFAIDSRRLVDTRLHSPRPRITSTQQLFL